MRPDGRIVKANATLASLVGLSRRPDRRPSRLLDLLTSPGRVFYETHFAPLLRMQGFFDEIALDFVAADGERLPVLANAVERRGQTGRLSSFA